MEIKIDDTSIEFTLEQENTVGDVIAELKPFVESHARVISALSVDDVPFSIDEPAAWKDRTLTPIRRISVETTGPFEGRIADLETLIEYFTVFRTALQSREQARIEEVLRELSHVRAAVDPVLRFDGSGNHGGALTELEQALSGLTDPSAPSADDLAAAPERQIEPLNAAINRLLLLIDTRHRELSAPVAELERTARALSGYTESMSEVPVLLQTGKEREAMERIAGFSELMSRLLRLCSLAMIYRSCLPVDWNPQTLEDEVVQLNSVLQELVEAFDAGDSVLIGDLVEYEVVPGLQNLLRYVPAGDGQP